jgi:hypothetical protein
VLSLARRDSTSAYILTVGSIPNNFNVQILQPSGSGSEPINLEITAPENALPRLYKILIKYEEVLPQSVSYVNNCILRLTVQ